MYPIGGPASSSSAKAAVYPIGGPASSSSSAAAAVYPIGGPASSSSAAAAGYPIGSSAAPPPAGSAAPADPVGGGAAESSGRPSHHAGADPTAILQEFPNFPSPKDQAIRTPEQQGMLMDGPGRMFFKNGEEYNGQWKDGMFHGAGEYTFGKNWYLEGGKWQRESIRSYKGQWKLGKFVGAEGGKGLRRE